MRITALRRRARSWWRTSRRLLAALRKSPPLLRFVLSGLLILLALAGTNWVYQVAHKPTEVLFPLDDTLNKSLRETWREYGPLFREHATAVMTPELLAALAQLEGAGNPVARRAGAVCRAQRVRRPDLAAGCAAARKHRGAHGRVLRLTGNGSHPSPGSLALATLSLRGRGWMVRIPN